MEITRQTEELEALKFIFMEAREKYEATIADLQLQLEASKRNETRLKRLNEDCYELLLVQRLESL